MSAPFSAKGLEGMRIAFNLTVTLDTVSKLQDTGGL